MLQIMKVNRMRRLMQQYMTLKNKALNFMKAGDLQKYIETITQANEVKTLYLSTARMTVAS